MGRGERLTLGENGAPAAPVIEQWRSLFYQSIAEGDFISRIQDQQVYGYGEGTKDPWEEGILDFQVENHPVRVALAQARYLRAVAEAAGQNITEQRALAKAVDALAGEAADMRAQLADLNALLNHAIGTMKPTVVQSAEAQTEISQAVSQIAEHLARANELAEAHAQAASPYDGLPGWLRWLCRTFGTRASSSNS